MGLDFDIRYKQIINLLQVNNTGKVLEIGALPPACLSNYLGKEIDYLGINKNYSDSEYRIEELDFVANSFKDDYFTHSVSTDTLEHVEKANRQRFIDEMVRVTQNTIIMGVPNPECLEYEKTLVKLLEASDKGKHYIEFFKEHEAFGVPSREEMRSYLLKHNYTTLENFNLKYWIGILLSDVFDFDINLDQIIDINEKPAYRTFYVIKK